MDLISKKELLALTGISYGQLYRWKREKLIPEEWFIKRSAYTGQETFFPREQILSRVRTILDAKDQYTLEELARMFSPEVHPSFCDPDELPEISEISPALLAVIEKIYPKERYEFYEVLVFAVVSQVLAQQAPLQGRAEDVLSMALGAAKDFNPLAEATMTLFQEEGRDTVHLLLVKTATPLLLDRSLTVLGSWDLGPIAGAIKLKYQKLRR